MKETIQPHQLRHVEIASQSRLLKSVISMSREPRDLLFGEQCQQGTIWYGISLKRQDGSRWALGAINQISISPDGTTIFATEDLGRFAVIRVLESSHFVANSYLLPYYVKMDVRFESKNKRDIQLSFAVPRSIRVLTNPNSPDIVMRGIEIKSFTWLDHNRFIAISYEDGRIVKFDTHKMRIDCILRTSQWKWSQKTGPIEHYSAGKKKLNQSVEIFLAEDEKTEFVRTIGVFADEYFVFQNYSRVCSIVNLKNRNVISQPKQSGYVLPISKYQFAIISKDKHTSHCDWIDVRNPKTSITYDVEGLFDREKYLGYPLLSDGYISNEGIIQLLVSDSSGFRYSCAAIKRDQQKKLPTLSKHDTIKLSDKDIQGAIFGPGGKSIRYCKYPNIVELKLVE